MKRLRWVADGFGDRALLRVCAALVLVWCAVLPASARTHPAPLRAARERHIAVAPVKHAASGHKSSERARAHRVAQNGSETKSSPKPKMKAQTHDRHPVKGAARDKPQPKGAGKAKHRKLRPEEEADNDPLPLQRVAARKKAVEPLKKIAAAAPAPEKKVLTSGDFLRAAGESPSELAKKIAPLQPVAETFEHGESHPDDDERLPMNRVQGAGLRAQGNEVTAMVSAAPEMTVPAGKPTLPEKLEAMAVKAVKADAAAAKSVLAKKDVAKPPALPLAKTDKDAVIEAAMTPTVLPVMYRRNGRLIVPPPMKGTHEILVHQNLMADNAGLDRIQDDEDLDRMRAEHLLVALLASRSLDVNDELPMNRRYARPWAARFAADIARNFYAKFREPLRLNSAVRTVEYQRRLQRVNGNAAGTDGEDASPHLTGQAIDFGKRGMSVMEIAWMRAYLLPLMQAGKIDVEEEFLQSCFHVSVYKSYLPAAKKAKAAPKMEVAQVRAPVRQEDEALQTQRVQ